MLILVFIYTWKNIKSEYSNNKFKILDLILPDGSYSIAYIQDWFEFIIKKHEAFTENPQIHTSLSK